MYLKEMEEREPEESGQQPTQQLYGATDRLFEVRQELKKLKEEEAELKRVVLDTLEANDIPVFRSNKGTVSVKPMRSVSCPKDPERKKEFFRFLEDQGMYWDYVTVNSRTLNSWYNAEVETAFEEALGSGKEPVEPQIPGLDAPFVRSSLSITPTKGRK